MFSRCHLFSRPRIAASAAGCRRGGAELTVFAFQINLGARGDAGPFLTTDRGASGDSDWEADVEGCHARRAVVRGGVDKVPREERNR